MAQLMALQSQYECLHGCIEYIHAEPEKGYDSKQANPEKGCDLA